ncbi:MAG: hypothetical protein JXA18_15255, partial [Chitinispirillaceae bacterium]|nr:hypothetical protein [Chitinispirillaceae bacterium]
MVRMMWWPLLAGALVASASTDVSLKGTVKDGSGKAISGAVVILAKKSTLKDTTDAQGIFELVTSVGVATPYAISIPPSSRVTGTGNMLQFSLTGTIEQGNIAIFSSSGRQAASIDLGRCVEGNHTVALPDLIPGFYVMHMTIGEEITTRKLMNTGSGLYISDAAIETGSGFRAKSFAAAAPVDTLIVSKAGYTTAKQALTTYTKSDIAIVLTEEVVGECVLPTLPDPSGLTKVNDKLPDPFMFYDGTRMTKKSQWQCRRKEILAMAQKYIYGPTPEVNPADVTGTISGGTVSANIKVNGSTKSANFSIGSSGKILNVSYGSGLTPSGTRNWNIQNSQMDSYNTTIQSIYGSKAGCRVMAAVWAVNVVCAVIKKNSNSGIDYVMTTGCSASAKSAFVTGAFCEGVDL